MITAASWGSFDLYASVGCIGSGFLSVIFLRRLEIMSGGSADVQIIKVDSYGDGMPCNNRGRSYGTIRVGRSVSRSVGGHLALAVWSNN